MTSRIFTTDDASKFLSDLNKGGIREDLKRDAYGHTYRALIKLASSSSDDPQHNAALSLACAVYGWMPTTLKGSRIQELGSTFSIEKIKSIKSWEDAKMFLIAIDDVAPINSSWVGTSKFLHFLNPEIFPIWDSRVAVSFHSKIAIEAKRADELDQRLRKLQLNHFCNRKDHYLEYSKFMLTSVNDLTEWVDEMQNTIEREYKNFPTKLRCLELVLFNRY